MITAIIPARSGSKRLPGKNIKKLAGKPLVFHTIDSVIGHSEITHIIFTTDSEEYINLAKEEYGDQINYEYRPAEYAGDHVKVYDELKRLVKGGIIKTEWYMQCLPTCPLRNQKIVRGLLDQWKIDTAPVFSAVDYDFPTQFAFSLSHDGKGWEPMTEESPMITGNTRSQDIPKTYRPNGAMYLQHVDNIGNKTLYMDADAYLMSREDSIDIDTELDFLLTEHILANRK
jgi:CMP-N,N'-diacetyllegionaminic acid synthase